MLFQIINAAKAHDLEDMLFSHNGLAGLGILCIHRNDDRALYDRSQDTR